MEYPSPFSAIRPTSGAAPPPHETDMRKTEKPTHETEALEMNTLERRHLQQTHS